ncbi:MAG TPA: HEAT repeat domain-containing protein [Chitinophagaceae bacterium]|nr:HEAT repeat domain-containing protein [Chitinophagaceae bacterium]
MASFKTDESFLEKISLGAIGTQQVFKKLIELGHHPIELERGSMSYKIWKKIKIKRIRVPDIICIDNGIRIESRAKSKLEITMSHSLNDPSRGWDADLKNEDYVALVACKKGDLSPVDWVPNSPIQFISVRELRESFKRKEVITEKAKGVQEGSEVRITWLSCIAGKNLTIIDVTEDKIVARSVIGRTSSCKLKRNKGGISIDLRPQVKIGDKVLENQIIASVVPIEYDIPKGRVDVNYFIANLSNLNHSERYAAAKALRFFNEEKVIAALKSKASTNEEHIYVRLEAAASLAILGEKEGYLFIEESLKDQYLQNVLESVIVLNEIKSEKACELLCDVLLNEAFDPEIRAGAAWGLGEQQNKNALAAIVSSFNAVDESIRIEAARALAKLTKNYSVDILQRFTSANSIEKPGVAWALGKSNSITLDQLLNSIHDFDSKEWVSYIIGTQGEEKYIAEIEKIKAKDTEVYFAVTLLWKIMTSWVYDLKEY